MQTPALDKIRDEMVERALREPQRPEDYLRLAFQERAALDHLFDALGVRLSTQFLHNR